MSIARLTLLGLTLAIASSAISRSALADQPGGVKGWTGPYVGVSVGGSWDSSDANIVSSRTFANPLGLPNTSIVGASAATGATTGMHNGIRSFAVSGHVGYDYKIGKTLVAGVVADIQGFTGGNNSNSITTTVPLTGFPGNTAVTTLTTTNSLGYLGTLRGRLGVLASPTLLAYATGGLAYGGVSSSTDISQQLFGLATSSVNGVNGSSGSFSDTRIGWSLGGGLEWLVFGRWSTNVEYLHYDLGKANYSAGVLSNVVIPPGGAVPTGAVFYSIVPNNSTKFSGDIVRLGLSYKF